MFDLNKITPVLEHLKQISPNMYRKNQKEVVIHCPFCDDATRKNASHHGHLYVAMMNPVFHCFRCTSSGTLLSLLIQTGFTDDDVLKYISSFIKINFTKDYFKMRNRINLAPRFSQQNLKKMIFDYNLNFKRNNYNDYIRYTNYLNQRIGNDINVSEFLISPAIYKNNLICRFTNYIGENVLLRYIDDIKGEQRYQVNKTSSSLYYFQNINDSISKITICEGPFDVINLYLYCDVFKNNTFISINGKNYINNIERLILMYYLIDEIEINIVFDSDYYNKHRKILLMLQKIIQIYNGKIWINAYKPLIGNDVADFPAVVKL